MRAAAHSDQQESTLAAGGSLHRIDGTRHPSSARRIWLLCELGLFYLGAPLAIIWAVHTWGIPLFVALQPILLGFIAYLLWDQSFKLRNELAIGISLRAAVFIALVFVALGSAVAAATYWLFPGLWLSFPRWNPNLWLFVMAAYPLLSVIPQELVYRTFFFHRYGPLFGGFGWLAILVNGALFGFAHVIFGNIIAVAGTVVLGCILAFRYEATRSIWAVWLEHSLWGCLIFTIGLGRFFFTGVSNLN